MVKSSVDDEQANLTAAFDQSIDALRNGGLPCYPPLGGRTPWAESSEIDKLEAIVWESQTVWLRERSSEARDGGLDVIRVSGTDALAAIERNIDYAGLPPVQAGMLRELRATLDSGPLDAAHPEHKDLAGMALARIVGAGEFDERLEGWKECTDRPWAGRSEAEKVSAMVGIAAEVGPPGAYALAAIEREVDYDKLPPWRRDLLEDVRTRIDRGELGGENPSPAYQGDRAEDALRMAELEARIEDFKHLGAPDRDGRRWPWQKLSDAQRLYEIDLEIDDLHLGSETRVREIVLREVDIAHLSPERRRVLTDEWQEPGPTSLDAERGTDARVEYYADDVPANGRYQVWQDRGWPQSRIEQIFGGSPSRFPEDFVHVANVQAESLDEAVALTTDTGSILAPSGHVAWQGKEGVQALLEPPFSRDTDVGDVIVGPNGRAFRVEREGFAEITGGRPRTSPGEIADDDSLAMQGQHYRRDDGRGQ
jgi:hypothetical protein